MNRRQARTAISILSTTVTLTFIGCSDAQSDKPAGRSDSTVATKSAATPEPASSNNVPGRAPNANQGDDVALASITEFIQSQKIDTNQNDWKTQLPKPPQAEFDPEKTYYWLLETNVGPIKLKLLPDEAPMHVTSTIYLTELGFYDEVPFHRVINGFMAQGGDPLGRGTGGPGYQYDGEFGGTTRHDKPGILSMANAGPGTDGSQFFITFVPTPHLDGRHTVFGEVVDGSDTLAALEAGGSGSGRTTQPLLIESATIEVQ
ncbi:MAG: peptidylprolyl isomerase [Myxococcota bacterium]|nr:peptidylprolyl isomerase [Myxococcota bacterium]